MIIRYSGSYRQLAMYPDPRRGYTYLPWIFLTTEEWTTEDLGNLAKIVTRKRYARAYQSFEVLNF